jgi:hypothetical protein
MLFHPLGIGLQDYKSPLPLPPPPYNGRRLQTEKPLWWFKSGQMEPGGRHRKIPSIDTTERNILLSFWTVVGPDPKILYALDSDPAKFDLAWPEEPSDSPGRWKFPFSFSNFFHISIPVAPFWESIVIQRTSIFFSSSLLLGECLGRMVRIRTHTYNMAEPIPSTSFPTPRS